MSTIVLSAPSPPAAQVHYAAPIQFLLRQFLHVDDLRGHEDGLVARRIRNGHVDQRSFEVPLAALKAQASARHVFACDNVVLQVWAPHAGLEVHTRARVLSPILLLLGGNAGAGSRRGGRLRLCHVGGRGLRCDRLERGGGPKAPGSRGASPEGALPAAASFHSVDDPHFVQYRTRLLLMAMTSDARS